MNQAAAHLETRRALKGLYKVEVLIRKKGGAREL